MARNAKLASTEVTRKLETVWTGDPFPVRAPLSLWNGCECIIARSLPNVWYRFHFSLFSLSNGCSTTRGVKIQSAGLRFMARPLDAFEIDDEGEGGDLLSAIWQIALMSECFLARFFFFLRYLFFFRGKF